MIKNSKYSIMLVLISMSGIMILISLINSYKTVDTSIKRYLDEYLNPDAIIQINPTNKESLEVLNDIQGIEKISTRMVVDATIRKYDGSLITGRFFTKNNKDIPKMDILSSSEENNEISDIEVSFCSKFLQRNGYNVGDTITILTPTGEKEAIIKHVVSSPESMMITRNSFAFMDSKDFGYVYLDYENFSKIFNYYDTYNQILLKFSENSGHQKILDEVTEKLQPIGVLSAKIYEGSDIQEGVNGTLKAIKMLAVSLPIIFFLVTLIFIFIAMEQIVYQYRGKIGILKALGFDNVYIISLFCMYAFIISIVAFILGSAFGVLLCDYISENLRENWNLPYLVKTLEPSSFIYSLLFSIAIGQISCIFATFSIIKMNLAEILRGKKINTHLPPLIVRTIFKKLSAIKKILISQAFRNKKRFFLSTSCLAFSSILIMISLAFTSSLNFIAEHMFNERLVYDCQVYFSKPLDDDTINKLKNMDNVKNVEELIYYETKLNINGNTRDILINGISDKSQLIHVFDRDLKEIDITEDGIILEENLANDLSIGIGDTVYINGNNVVVKNISRENANYIQYCSIEEAKRLSNQSANINGIVCSLTSSSEKNNFNNTVSKLDGFMNTTFTEAQHSSIYDFWNNIQIYAKIVTIVGILLGVGITYSIFSLSFLERKREYAILIALGIKPYNIFFNGLTEAFLQLVTSSFLSIPISLYINNLVLNSVRTKLFSFPVAYFSECLAFTFLLITLSILLGYTILLKEFKNFNLGENLKAID